VSADTIRWIESANNYVQLHCGAKDYLLGESLSSLERRLDPEKFLRVHRCFIVSLAYVSAVHSIAGGAYEIELRGGTRIKSGRQYRDVLQKLIRA
jgi:two-component system LytT family response regulator